jgi:hypothetical protein
MIDITSVHMSVGGTRHEHIEAVRWQNPENGQTGENLRSAVVQWLREGGRAYVVAGGTRVDVGVVDANPPYLRTHADGVWKDNLLALPRY